MKSLGLDHPDAVDLTTTGSVGDRRFFVVDGEGRLFRGALHGPLVRISPRYDAETERLRLRFPDGSEVEASAVGSEPLTADFFGRAVAGRLLAGEFHDALSSYVGKELRLARVEHEGAGSDTSHRVTILGDGSVAELQKRAGRAVDPRRFRMLFDVSGLGPHEEDTWNGALVSIGGAVVRVAGPVGRCANTTYDPATGERDLDTLRLIKAYRGLFGRSVCFGVYADVVEPGRVHVGDPVSLDG